MIKKILSLVLVAFMSVALASCKSKAEKVVSEFESLTEQFVDAVEDGDQDKLMDIAIDFQELGEKMEDMDEEDFDKDQKKRIMKCVRKIQECAWQTDFDMDDMLDF